MLLIVAFKARLTVMKSVPTVKTVVLGLSANTAWQTVVMLAASGQLAIDSGNGGFFGAAAADLRPEEASRIM